MGQWNDWLSRAKNVGGTIGKKTGDLFDVTRLKLNMTQLQGEIGKTYGKLGEIVYQASVTGKDAHALVQVCIQELDEQFARLEQLGEQVNDLQHIAKCPRCGYRVSQELSFCPKCGAALHKQLTTSEEDYLDGREDFEDDYLDATEAAPDAVEEMAAFTTPPETFLREMDEKKDL